jgi:micrococcal nuclease
LGRLPVILFGALSRPRRVAAFLLSILLCPAATCWASESGRVVEVIDGDTIRVSIVGVVESVRLIGVDTPEIDPRRPVELFGKEASEFTRRSCLGEDVRLERDPQGDTRDKYGRLLRYVYLPDGTLLNAEIIRQGYGHAYTRFPYAKMETFRALEREAREAGRGLWGNEHLEVLTTGQARAHIGEVATVCGVVASTKYATRVHGAPTFLNLDRPYPDHPFTIVIWETDRSAFGEPEVAYANESMCVTGKIDAHRGEPQIVARDPSQIDLNTRK